MRALILIVIACGSIACTTTQLIEPSPEATHTLPAPTDTAPSSPTPIPPEPTLSEVQVIDGIQHTLDLYAQAYNENDPDLFEQVVDQTNFPFRRFVRARFDSFRDSIFGKYTQFSFDVMHVEPRDFGFMQAHITTGTDFATDWLFRQETDGRWVLSEPSVEQIDTPILIESEHFTFQTYAWTSDAVNDQLIEMMEIARQRVLERLGKVPDENILVEINPIYALNPFDAPGAAAIYIAARNQREPDRIRIYAPYSFT